MANRNGGRNDSLSPSDFRGSNTGTDKRRELRVQTKKTISIMPCDRDWNSSFHQVDMVDCSLHGIAIVASLRFEAGERFLAKLRVNEKMALSAYTSRHCIQLGEKYRVGAEFTGLISSIGENTDEILGTIFNEASKA